MRAWLMTHDRPLRVIAVLAAAAAGAIVTLALTRHDGAPPASAAGTASRSGFLLLPPAAPAGQMTLFGQIRRLSRTGNRVVLRFDPAWFTTGLTASTAKRADTGSSEVPNDVYVVDESHRQLTYLVAPTARITVLTNPGGRGIGATPIPVAELLRIVNGGPHRALFEPLASGVWIRVRGDTVRELDQQYRP